MICRLASPTGWSPVTPKHPYRTRFSCAALIGHLDGCLWFAVVLQVQVLKREGSGQAENSTGELRCGQ